MGSMRDFGVEWIDVIPEKWTTKKTKYLIKFINGYAFDSKELLQEGEYAVIRIGDIKNGTISYENCLYIKNNEGLEPYKVHKNDLLLAMSGATVGKVGIASNDEIAYINQRVGIIRSENARFIYYLLSTSSFLEYINLESVGSAQPNISSIGVGKFHIPCPTNEEQRIIADFLDDKVGKIDNILNELNRQIEILNRYKKSLITEKIDKGLTNNAKFTKQRLKYICKAQGRIGFKGYSVDDLVEEHEGALTLGATHITNNKIDLTNPVFISWKKYFESPEIMLKKGNILVVQRGSIGNVAIIEDELGCATINPSLIILRDFKGYNKYFYYLLLSDNFKRYIDLINTATAVPMISQNQLYNFEFNMPNIEEQKKIAKYLENKCEKIDEIIKVKQIQIEKMEKYKKSLIYEYVTGKKRVKGAEELYG